MKTYLKKMLARKKRIVIYTAITGNYDDLIMPKHINENCDYICFTDNPTLVSDFWQVRIIDETHIDNIRKARKYKVLPHLYLPEYKYSLWVDANFEIIGDVEKYIMEFSNHSPMLCIIHPERDCIYEEALACINQNKDDKQIIQKQIKKYSHKNYPIHNGLIASGVLFRKHNDPNLTKIMNEWWSEIMTFSRRDQLSFNYVCWDNSFSYDECQLNCWENRYFKRLPHSQKKID